ncbi:AbrB protein [Pediococcus acidilactici]|uniref:AbrB protein n=1 Tax=Pediococcus acidilactici TaxID=1254 RepID=UPI001322C809|nr:AbrB protein [Pediococcus acidilactici]KAF0361976.1 AbrB protein [Pediococcus acidilactici]KAF0365748.1 AbrB protein [Pediococcus acidilactici]KAF0416540.1 AbrB protein [Pediococcus acidilactici]KAF0420332.1 AbrB protein [Pediococcus acidilactici]KAF0472177.1 AbrB protein [Pediococcus acidilactici]
MKSLRITLPLAVAVILVVATKFFHLSGAPLVISWVVGFLFSMITTTVIEVRLRMKKFVEEQKKEAAKKRGEQ